jgi:hypothetical protein
MLVTIGDDADGADKMFDTVGDDVVEDPDGLDVGIIAFDIVVNIDALGSVGAGVVGAIGVGGVTGSGVGTNIAGTGIVNVTCFGCAILLHCILNDRIKSLTLVDICVITLPCGHVYVSYSSAFLP